MPILKTPDPFSSGLLGSSSIAGIAKSLATDAPISTTANYSSDGFDASGWNVNVGSGSPTQTSTNTTPLGMVSSLANNPLVLIAIGIGLIFYFKK